MMLACSAPDERGAPGERDADLRFHLLTPDGVRIDSASFDLNTQGGADVAEGAVPVPNDDSAISLGIESLTAGDYVLGFAATGTLRGQPVACVSAPALFHLNPGQHLALPDITLVCTVTQQSDTSSGIDANLVVVIETVVVGSVVETFTYGPRAVKGLPNAAGVCEFPPIALKIASKNPSIVYQWSTPGDGTFALNAAQTQGTYTCASGGNKTLTVTGTLSGVSSSKSVTVTCDSSACTPEGPVCGNGLVEPPEQCDDTSARCASCRVSPVCGDGIVDPPEQCEPGTSTPSCLDDCTLPASQ
jgi:hypothetical protein